MCPLFHIIKEETGDYPTTDTAYVARSYESEEMLREQNINPKTGSPFSGKCVGMDNGKCLRILFFFLGWGV